MDIIKLHDRALEATTAIVANVDPGQFGAPTPCDDFDVRALLNHMIGGNYRFVKIAQGEPGQAVPPRLSSSANDFTTRLPWRKEPGSFFRAEVFTRTSQCFSVGSWGLGGSGGIGGIFQCWSRNI